MRNREETVRFIEIQLSDESDCAREKRGHHHYGWQDLRELMDFIYGGEPKTKAEELTNTDEYRKTSL